MGSQAVATAAHRGPPYERVCFDCDSTLCTIEGLDRLAARAGIAAELQPVTAAAMNGEIDFDNAYAERLALLQPDQAAVDWLAEQYQSNITPGANDLIRGLRQAGKQIHIVSGGILQALLSLAAPLGVPVSHIHAVSLLLDVDGSYQDFDRDSPLCRQHGKAALCRMLFGKDERAVFIGDGITDWEATAAGVDFIGYGGVIKRDEVVAQANISYPTTDLTGLLSYLLTPTELQAL